MAGVPQAAVALVTGAARRIGAAIAADLARHGFTVALHAHGAVVEAEALAGTLRAEGCQVEAFGADLTDADAAAGLVGTVSAQLGPVRLLVNNASIFEPDSADAPDLAVLDRAMALHVRAPTVMAARMAAGLVDGTGGLVVNMIDQRVWRLTPAYYSYTLSKAALWTATRTMAMTYAPSIRVNAIGPGPTLPNERQSEADFNSQVRHVPLRRAPDLAEFGATVRHLWATPSITGQMIALDSGQHLAWETPDYLKARE